MTSNGHFSRAEQRCPHCQGGFLRPRLLAVLELVRAELKRPLPLISAYRCPIHNRAVGGAVDSQHQLGTAADIPSGLLSLGHARRAGAVGIGTKGEWVIHVDVRDGKPVTWRY